MKSAIAALGLAATLVAAGPVMAQQAKNAGQQAFVKEAIQGDLAEVQLGQLAQEKAGNNQQLSQFGKMLVNDHSAHKQKAEALARNLGVAPPTSPNAKQQQTYEQLSKLSGEQFAKKFATDAVADHQKDISHYSTEAKSSNAQVAHFAQETIPVLKKHLQTAEALEKSASSAKE